MSKKYEIDGHDINKFQQYYIQENGKGFSLEDPPTKIYYFNKYGGWRDEIDGKVFYYDQDCNPWIENIPSDIEELQHSQDQDAQEGASQSDRYDQEIQQDLKDYSASSDDEEHCQDDEEEEHALEEMTSSSEQEYDYQENMKQEQQIQDDQNQKNTQIQKQQQQNLQSDHQERSEEQDDYEEEEKSQSNHQTDETNDSERFRKEYINELIDIIQQNKLETTCIHIEKIPADLNESDLLLSFGVSQKDQSNVLSIFYGPIEKEILDEDEEEEQKNDQEEEFEVKNAVLVVSSKDFAKQLVQNEGKPIVNYQDRDLYLDILTESKDYYPMPAISDQMYIRLLENIKNALLSGSKFSKLQIELTDSSQENLFKSLKQQYNYLNIDKLSNQILELDLDIKFSWKDTLISLWNYLYNTDKINIIKDVKLI
ncbi:hypothetical protein TTHERM_00151450 (macronuclear) [Tetrahymena thermophila SB210]|uniref:Uncharacterized protein n=1 Tax=Tetrahymena thermophila (strain SB210) TaxID=312017 RepID=I7M2W6_TETTS|nr:hypothetical protein TTHERM_00151450 [Tetrahymena thermophila SB210]EAS01435.1 hypothetical protein TTHERM_00151450 [Tetrahymena thermophila SB210]|eukprot:XP_001021681.1 hypothetical protein TTHERM_00151450 [Tetrahymena thermophila SB210]